MKKYLLFSLFLCGIAGLTFAQDTVLVYVLRVGDNAGQDTVHLYAHNVKSSTLPIRSFDISWAYQNSCGSFTTAFPNQGCTDDTLIDPLSVPLADTPPSSVSFVQRICKYEAFPAPRTYEGTAYPYRYSFGVFPLVFGPSAVTLATLPGSNQSPQEILTLSFDVGCVSATYLETKALNFTNVFTSPTNVAIPYRVIDLGYNRQNTLPVAYLDFRATPIDEREILLEWTTLREQNSDFFGVERSFDAESWTEIGQIGAAGTSSEPNTYEFNDRDRFPPIVHYRLRQVDLDGSFSYSEIMTVNLPQKAPEIRLFPQPAYETAKLKLHNVKQGRYTLYIYDAQGRMIQNQLVEVTHSVVDEVDLQLQDLAGGTYWLRLASADAYETLDARLIKR